MSDFPDVSKAEWLAKAAKDLKGRPLDSLNFTLAGAELSPFWHREDLAVPPPPLPRTAGWKIGVRITDQVVERANELALEALTGGAESLWFSFYRPLTAADRERLLAGIHTGMIDLVIDEEETQGGRGSFPYDLAAAVGRPTHPPAFFTTATADFYATLATNRAVRRCWQLAADTLSTSTACHLTTFVPPLSETDVHQNKISATVAAVAAVCGGADTLFIAPSEGPATAFSRRIARNVQHLLREESHLHRVADPAAGSYFFENLTDTIARRFWAEFQQLTG